MRDELGRVDLAALGLAASALAQSGAAEQDAVDRTQAALRLQLERVIKVPTGRREEKGGEGSAAGGGWQGAGSSA